MSRKIIDGRAREIVIKLDDYFFKEKEDSKPLLQNVNQALQSAFINYTNEEHVILSKQTTEEIFNYFKKLSKVTERVVSATGIAKNTVTKIRREKDIAIASGSKIKTPVKRKRGKKEFLDEFELSALRNIIYSVYTVRKEIPNMRQILAAAQKDLDYKGSETTLRSIIKTQLGYRFKKHQNKSILIERPNFQALRAKYLYRMKENYLSLGDLQKPVIYIGETWIETQTHYTVKMSKQSIADVGERKNVGRGPRWIMLHAGNEEGFVDNAFLMFKTDPKTGNHKQISSDTFTQWLLQNLIPNIPQSCIIVMDSAPYQAKEEDSPPNMSSTKQEMVEWLQARRIEFPEYYTRPELYLLIRDLKVPKKYTVDRILADHGHEVVRLPPHNCDLNAIEYVWNLVKQRIADCNAEPLENKMESLILKILATVTPGQWKMQVNHVKKLEEEYWRRDRLVDELLAIQIESDGESDTTDSEANAESDLDCMSETEEY